MAPISLAISAVLLLALVQAWRVVYRLLFHPLASVPGTKLAAATTLWQFYWDAVRGGKMVFRLEEMHQKYGPIIRIGPNEVHISDPAYWDVLYNSTNKLDKHGPFYCFDGSFNATGGASYTSPPSAAALTVKVTTVQHEVHRKRRGAMNKFLSAANVSKLEPQVQVFLKKMLDRFDEIGRAGEPCDCFNAFRSLTMDVISIFTERNPRNNLDEPDFAREMHRNLRTAASSISWQRFVPIMTLMDVVPLSVWMFIDPEIAKLIVKREVSNPTG
ncbi:hypothetical protein SLS56_007875 [Neofusicoccum ribis]|uniref:Cytochrome P450 n=1 Tax=Neofusicoccum ribis TaxID=45134 RepID=A0ABR3SLQ4_9PEZI